MTSDHIHSATIRLFHRVSSMANKVANLNPFFDIKLDVKSNNKELNNNTNAIRTHTQPMIRPLNGRIRSPDLIDVRGGCG